jgi:group I intron endonuclease
MDFNSINHEESNYYGEITEEEILLVDGEVYGVIYKITNKLNNKSYIGRKKIYSKNYNDLHNYFGSGIHIKNSIKKYGIENFKKEYLDIAYSDEELDKKEMYYIKKYNTFKEGYNATEGGEHFRGEFSNNELRKQKISEWSKNFWKDDENRNKIINSRIGKKRNSVTKKKMSESAKNSWTEERRKKASESGNYIRHFDEETRKRIAESLSKLITINNGKIEKRVSESELENYLSQGFIKGGLSKSEEAKKKMSEAAKKSKRGYGFRWVHKDQERKRIKEEEIEKYLKDGWKLSERSSYNRS